MPIMLFSPILTFLLLGPATSAKPTNAVPPGDVAALVGQVQKRYDDTIDLKARFSQEVTTPATGRKKLRTGLVMLKKPGRMRMDYEKPEKQMYLSTGQIMWFFQPEERQAFKQDPKTAQLPAAFAFLMGKGRLIDEFEITVTKELPYGGPGDHKLSLKPKQPQSTYKSIFFVVDPKTFLVKQSVLITATGEISSLSFTDIVVNTKVADSAFKWTPPAGIKVVDVAKLGK